MSKMLLDHDPWTGATTTFSYDESEDLGVIQMSADVQDIIDANTQLANHTDGWTAGGTMRLAARIPVVLNEMWKIKYGIDATKAADWPKVKKMLNSNEWHRLRASSFFRL